MSSSLELTNIKKSFGKTVVLKELDLEIKPEEFLVLVGPSGSGKSTIIRIIAGLEKEDQGTIVLNNENIENKSPKDRNLSMVFQNYALYPHKTVFDNIAFPLKMANQDSSSIKVAVQKIAEKLQIDKYLARKPKELSGGQRQRVALARAMIKDPEVFLMDEPLSNLDAKLRAEMRSEIHKLHKETNKIFIYVTHDQIEALTLGNRIAVINEGVIQQIASPEELYNNPRNTFVAGFIGSPPTNLLKLDPEKITGIRPEYISLESSSDQDLELKTTISNIELLGSEFLIYGHCQDQKLVAKINYPNNGNSKEIINVYDNFNIGDEINLYFNPSKAYYFDNQTGEKILAIA